MIETNGNINNSKNSHLADYSNNAGAYEVPGRNQQVGNWEAPRPKRRGRKPGSGMTNRSARLESDNGEQGDVRRRKRDTEVLVGDQIRRLRLDAGLSQEELGRASHMSTSYISRLETNEVNPTVDALNRIVRVFGLTIDGLLGLDTNSPGILDSDEIDPQIRVLLFKLKGKKISERTKRILDVVVNQELEALREQEPQTETSNQSE